MTVENSFGVALVKFTCGGLYVVETHSDLKRVMFLDIIFNCSSYSKKFINYKINKQLLNYI